MNEAEQLLLVEDPISVLDAGILQPRAGQQRQLTRRTRWTRRHRALQRCASAARWPWYHGTRHVLDQLDVTCGGPRTFGSPPHRSALNANSSYRHEPRRPHEQPNRAARADLTRRRRLDRQHTAAARSRAAPPSVLDLAGYASAGKEQVRVLVIIDVVKIYETAHDVVFQPFLFLSSFLSFLCPARPFNPQSLVKVSSVSRRFSEIRSRAIKLSSKVRCPNS